MFREQFTTLRLGLARRHVVIAGVGGKGSRLARALLGGGDRVVVVDADRDNGDLATPRVLGALVVVGDARSVGTLRRAGVQRARRLVVLCGDDGVNTQVVAAARRVRPHRHRESATCVAHIADPELCVLLCVDEFDRYGREQLRVEFVNLNAVAVQALLHAHPPLRAAGPAPRVVVVGAGTTAHHLTCAVARTWALMPGHDDRGRLQLRWVAPASPETQAWRDRNVEVGRCTDLDLATGLNGALRDYDPDIVYVCPDDDGVATETALRLRGVLSGRSTRIVVVLTTVGGLGDLLHSSTHAERAPSVATFGMLDETCQPEVLLCGTTELLAQAIHRTYLAGPPSALSPETDPALRPWEELPEPLRESNRDHAAHVAVKLRAVGLTIGPLVDWATALQPFSEDEVEAMARLEHDRWVTERQMAGWRSGPRDFERRTTPYLVPWEELAEELRDQDRLFIRALPRVLAGVGLQVLRPSDVLSRRQGRDPAPDVGHRTPT